MKRVTSAFVACLSLLSFTASASETAQARMYCISVRVFQGSNIYGDLLKVNSDGMADGDFELGPSQPWDSEISLPGTTSYGGLMWIWDNTYSYWSSGNIYLSLPDFTDVNNNQLADFFEVSRGLRSVTSYGSYSYYDPQLFDYYNGYITAVWARPAGSKIGTYTMTVSDTVRGNYWGTMYGTFEILEYTGQLSYTPGTTNVTGTLNLTQTGSNSTFTGSVQFQKSDTNHFDSLIIQPGNLVDAAQQPYYFTNRYFFRDTGWPTNYSGYVQFDDDYDSNTYHPWAVWVLSITDTNDSDHNGIPDFSDDAQIALPRQPMLSLSATPTSVLLTIHGDPNHVHQIQRTTSLGLGTTTWENVTSLTLTNDPVVVPLTVLAGTSTFWRVVAQ